MEKIIAQLLDKVSNYQFLNNLIPGTLFCVILPQLTSYDFMVADVWSNLVIIYFCGIIVSRFGSLFIEWLFLKCRIITFEPYPRYIMASEKAPFIKTLSMDNNMYRTFIALFFLLLLAKLSEYIGTFFSFWQDNLLWILCILLLMLCVFAYIKQTKYIVKRINEQLKSNE